MKVLVTGGAGYIGSTTAKALEEAGHTPVILDSLLTGPRAFVARPDLLRGRHRRPRAARAGSSTSTPTSTPPSTWPPGSSCPESVAQPVRVLPRQRRPSRWSSSTSWCARQAAGAVLVLRVAVRAPSRASRSPRRTPLDPPSPYARTKRMMEQVLAGHGRRHRPAGGDPALLQPDRLRPRPRVRASTPRSPPTCSASW